MPRYRWTGSGRFDGELPPGEVGEYSAHVGDPQPELVRVDDEAPDEDDDTGVDESDDNGGGTEAPFDPGKRTVTEIRDALAEADYDAAALNALAAAEQAGDARTTALEAIDAARD